MDIWRFWQVLCLIGLSQGNSDPLDAQIPLFDESASVPAEPLSPIDYQNGESIFLSAPPTSALDPIELAGLYEGDIVLQVKKNGIIHQKQKWPGAVVPFLISSQFNAIERSVIARSFASYHNHTCIKFRPRGSEVDYIHIVKGSGCSSLVGRAGGAQPVSLGPGCLYPGIVIHELMHAIGFWHEQSRADRDDHVNVYLKNIQPGMEFNFRKYSWSYIQNLSAPYDHSSLMHYGAYAFSRDRRAATILPKDPNKKIGQREKFSSIDLLKINRLYGCEGGSTTTTPPPPTDHLIKCKDNHKHCAYWAKAGECEKNGAWMLVNCKQSCKQCDKPCKDLNPYCSVWATRGDCGKTSHQLYMKSYCSKSCSSCKAQSELPPGEECEDKERFCAYWASKGECSYNPKFMGKYCPKSCKAC